MRETSKLTLMEKRLAIRLAIACGLLWSAAATSVAQTYTPPPPPLTTLPPCPLGKDGKPLKKQKSCDPTIYPAEKAETKQKSADTVAPAVTPGSDVPAAQRFPFPGEHPEQASKPADTPAAQAFPYPGSDSAGQTQHDSEVPHDPAAEKKAADTPAGKAYPFPGGATPDMPADPDMPAPAKQSDDQPSSSSSSSSSSDAGSSPDSTQGTKPADAPGPKGQYDDDDSAVPKLKDKSRKKAPPPQTDTERVDEDLSIAKYYSQSGNKMGAYLRAKDAVKVQPEYPEGHFALGDAARKLDKKDEAVAEFTTYLKLAPDGEHAKAAEKALEELH